MDPWSAGILRFGILLLIAPAFALLLRVSGLAGKSPAAAIVGGGLAGILAGPMVLGQLRPAFYDEFSIGAVEARAELGEMDHRHEREIVVLGSTGASAAAIEEQRNQQALERGPALDRVREAIAIHRKPARILSVAMVGIGFFAGAIFVRRRRPRAGDLAEVPPAIAAGLLVVLVTVLGMGVLGTWILRLDRSDAIVIGAATASGSAFTNLPMRWVGREGRRIAANAINVFAFLASMIVLILMAESTSRMAISGPVGGLFFGSLLRGRVRSTRTRRRVARGLILWWLVAPLTGFLVSEIDPRQIMDSWRTMTFVGVAVAMGGVGHMLGVVLGLKLLGTPRQRVRATAIWIESHAMGVSLTQVMLLVVLVAAGVVDARSPEGAAVIVGGLLAIAGLEMSIGLLRRMIAT